MSQRAKTNAQVAGQTATICVIKSSRARGSNRGGCGGGYEQTDPEYQSNKLRQLRQTYHALDAKFRPVFLDGLSRWEQKFVTNSRMEVPNG